jgi:hypothetical protein
MRQKNQIMIVFSMLLMLCGQTLASTLMWCCIGGEAVAVQAAPAPEPAMPMEMAHMEMAHMEMHHHDHAMPAVAVQEVKAVPAASNAMSGPLASTFDCAHACASSCATSALLATVLAPQAPIASTQTLPGFVPALPQTDPSLPFRPPPSAA